MMQRTSNLLFFILVLVILLGSVFLVRLTSQERVARDRGREVITCSEEADGS